ncbi:hypothetical protein EI555_013927 [Monodon monoceros]|uniref:Bleomycin hydrolase n=1 Tax=Monodon monoceros TaxID=40151 RepID=A0A4U1F7X6_MONMO|nr:hypothetical protein EI555_013927 [Monodon monoceros]
MVAASIKDGEAIWFGCDVGKHFSGKLGLSDMNVYDLELVFGVSMKNMNKAERLTFDEWFSEYVYEVVLDEEVLAVLEQEPIVLPAWDPMGALAE